MSSCFNRFLSAAFLLSFIVSVNAQDVTRSNSPFIHDGSRDKSERSNAAFQQKSQNLQENNPAAKKSAGHARPQFVPGEIIIKYEIIKENADFLSAFRQITNSPAASARPLVSVNAGNEMSALPQLSRTVLIRLDDKTSEVKNVIENINFNKSDFASRGFEIEYAQPNYLYYMDAAPNDPMYSSQWAHQVTQAAKGWDIQKGDKKIIIGVIDSGIDYLHEDLAANIVPSKGYDFVDIDTAGYKAAGWQLLSGEDYTQPDNDPMDFNGHGTHCAGIIGAAGNNSIGVTGVCQNISILPLRAGFSVRDPFWGAENGILEDDAIINAINYAVNNGAKVISMSFGSTAPSGAIKDALDKAYAAGVVLIAGAGNNSSDEKFYPAAFENVISVAATDQSDVRAYFSNYGGWVSIAAPGDNILSTVPKKGGTIANASGYRALSGTSMAAPYAAGLAGLLLSQNPNLTPQQTAWIMENSADIPKEAKTFIGSGRVNVLKALQTDPVPLCLAKTQITSPVEGQLVTQDLTITGSAEGTSYTLSYGQGVYPSSWTEICSGNYVSGGLALGTLKIQGIADGIYAIKLTVKDSKGTAEARVTVLIGNMSGMRAGFPQKFNSLYPGAGFEEKLAIEDLDGDGKKEIVVIAGTNTPNNDRMAESIFIYNTDGQLIRNWPLPYNGSTRLEPILADLDLDGKKEIIVQIEGGNFSTLWGKGCIQVWRYDGSQFPGWPQRTNIASDVFGFAAADINMDGKLDIIAATGGECCFDSSNVGQIHVFNSDGTYQKNWPYTLPYMCIPRSNLVIANLDADPAPEIIVTVDNNKNMLANYTYALKSDASSVPGFPMSQEYWGWRVAAGDLNGDGINEIITQDQLIDNKGKVLPWDNWGMHTYSCYALSDINNDQKIEVLYGDGNNWLYLVNNKGVNLSGWPKSVYGFSADGGNLIADVDGDQKPDIIPLWQPLNGGTLGPGLCIYRTDGTAMPGFPRFKDIMYMKCAVVADIDNDGLTEITGIDSRREVFVLNMDKKFNSSCAEWPSSMHDPWFTSVNIGKKQKFLSSFSGLSVEKNDSLKILIAPVYVNWDNYSVSAQADSAGLHVSVKDGVLTLKPEAGWSGSSKVRITVSNSFMTESSEFQVATGTRQFFPYRIKDLPKPEIKEDTPSAVVISNFSDYYRHGDKTKVLTYSCMALDKGLDSLKVDKTSLTVYPTKLFHGNLRIGVTAEDDLKAALKDTLYLTVIHINHAPLAFKLLGPAHNSSYSIPQDSKDTVTFSWEKPLDPDQDSLTFSFYSKDSLNILKTLLTNDPGQKTTGEQRMMPNTRLVLANVRKEMEAQKLSRLKGTWTIIARDGHDSTFATGTPFSLEFSLQTTGVDEKSDIPKEFSLYQNYPNPFNPSTTIKFGLPKSSHVRIDLYNLMGQMISKIAEDNFEAGYNEVVFNAALLPSGVYFYSISAGEFSRVLKMLVLK